MVFVACHSVNSASANLMSSKSKALDAMVLLRAREPVSTDRLQDNLMFFAVVGCARNCSFCGLPYLLPEFTPVLRNSWLHWFGRVGKRVCNEQCLTSYMPSKMLELIASGNGHFQGHPPRLPRIGRIIFRQAILGAVPWSGSRSSWSIQTHTAENKNDFYGSQVAAVTFAAPGISPLPNASA